MVRGLASASIDRTVSCGVRIDKELLSILDGHIRAVTGLASVSDGNRLAAATDAGRVTLWRLDSEQDKKKRRFHEHCGAVNSISFSPDSQTIASANSDGTIKLWRVDDIEDTKVQTFQHKVSVNSISFSPDGQTLPR
jgi:WD40 repeat protein